MKTIFITTQKDFDTSIRMMDRLLNTSEDSGILFVGIRIQSPCELFPLPIFHVTIGCENYPTAVAEYARNLLLTEVTDEKQLEIQAFKGKIKKNA